VEFVDGSLFVKWSLDSLAISPGNAKLRLRDGFLECVDGSAIYRCFGSCGSVVIPSSVVVIGKGSFCKCKSLESVVFVRGSRLERIEESAFCKCGLKSILIPSSVVVLGKSSFFGCKSLESVAFEYGSRLERIDESAFAWSGLQSIAIPSCGIVWGKGVFVECHSLTAATFDNGSPLKGMDESLFVGTPWQWLSGSETVSPFQSMPQGTNPWGRPGNNWQLSETVTVVEPKARPDPAAAWPRFDAPVNPGSWSLSPLSKSRDNPRPFSGTGSGDLWS
jgi:hypothetical protein